MVIWKTSPSFSYHLSVMNTHFLFLRYQQEFLIVTGVLLSADPLVGGGWNLRILCCCLPSWTGGWCMHCVFCHHRSRSITCIPPSARRMFSYHLQS